jgi:hypothetical protein
LGGRLVHSSPITESPSTGREEGRDTPGEPQKQSADDNQSDKNANCEFPIYLGHFLSLHFGLVFLLKAFIKSFDAFPEKPEHEKWFADECI